VNDARDIDPPQMHLQRYAAQVLETLDCERPHAPSSTR
jgi:hypothetical protein